MKRIFTAGILLLTAACSSHLPAPTSSTVSSGYQQVADSNRSAATVTVETAQPVALISSATRADMVICVGSMERSEYDGALSQALKDNEATMIEQYRSLHLFPTEVTIDGDRVDATPSEGYVGVYTDDGHEGSICRFELDKLRVVASQ